MALMSEAMRRVDANFMRLVLSIGPRATAASGKALSHRPADSILSAGVSIHATRRPIVPDHPDPPSIHAARDGGCDGGGTRSLQAHGLPRRRRPHGTAGSNRRRGGPRISARLRLRHAPAHADAG